MRCHPLTILFLLNLLISLISKFKLKYKFPFNLSMPSPSLKREITLLEVRIRLSDKWRSDLICYTCCIIDLGFTVKARLKTMECNGLTMVFLPHILVLSHRIGQSKAGSLLSICLLVNQQLVHEIPELFRMTVIIHTAAIRGHFSPSLSPFLLFLAWGLVGKSSRFPRETMLQPVIP